MNSLIFSASINSYFPSCIIISKFFKNIWVSALISSAFSQILNVIFKYSIVHLFIETNALIFSAFGQILAALLRFSLLKPTIETNALKFSSYVQYYSKSLNNPLSLLFVVFYMIQDLIILKYFVLLCQRTIISCLIHYWPR